MDFKEREHFLRVRHEELLKKVNVPVEDNGVYERFLFPVLTAAHAPLEWRYDFDPATNPYLMERFGIHAAFNSGAIKLNGRYYMVVRVEGADRKSFSPLRRATGEWTDSISGSAPSRCPNMASLPRIFTT